MRISPSRFQTASRSKKELTGCGLWFVRLFILPHTLAGIFLISQMLLTAAWLVAGDDITARVTHAWLSRGKKSTSYEIAYLYKDGPIENSETVTVSKEFYDQLPSSIKGPGPAPKSAPVGQTYPINVRLLSFGRIHHVAAIPPVGSAPVAHFAGTALIALFWNGILSVFLYQVWVKPYRIPAK